MPILARSFDENNLYYIMPRMRPGALDEVVGRKALSVEAAAHVTHEVLVFVDSLHRRSGKVHRDLKPANILVNKEAAVLNASDLPDFVRNLLQKRRVPDVCRSFIMQCLRLNPADRPDAASLLHDPFIRARNFDAWKAVVYRALRSKRQ
ncbi:Serine/threonine protein kinase [Aphelenchoides avenae]|nr:Serine/threonine protein kinase [Aphelenchus avenae]